MSRDESSAAARTTGELDVPPGPNVCQVTTLPKRKLCNLYWSKFATRVPSIVQEAAAEYAGARGREFDDTDAVVSRTICK